MENNSGVGLVNRYALFLDDESDPLDAIKAREQAKEQKKKTKEAEKENKGKPETKPKAAPTAPRKGIKETQNIKSQDGKPSEPKPKAAVRSGDRSSTASERPPPRRREDRPAPNGQIENKDGSARPARRERDFGDRKPYERRNFDGEGGERRGPRPQREPREPREPRGDGPPRGPRENREARGKREFERRSGSDKTGVKPVDKREGGGAHNWGNHKDDLEELNKTVSDGDQTEEKPEVVNEEQPAAPVEEEPKELTLDEYKALRNASRQKPQYNIRKAGEGEDLSQWKNMVALEKKKEAEAAGEEDSEGEYEISDFPQRVGRQKRFLGIEFTFSDNQRRGGGGRGRGRGRGAREGPRGGGGGGGAAGEPRAPRGDGDDRRRQQSAPKVDDSKDFPSLG